jgi:hypothetical protein
MQQNTSPKRAMDFILEVYRIERAALDADLLGTPEHLAMRQTRSRAVMDEFKAWLDAERPRHAPRGPMGEAITYALGQWNALTLFLTDPHLPIDNNASERALRVAALGRKNFLFVGHDEAGEHLARLYSLIATCEANDVNPVAYPPTCCSACTRTPPRASTSCCRTAGHHGEPSRRPEAGRRRTPRRPGGSRNAPRRR